MCDSISITAIVAHWQIADAAYVRHSGGDSNLRECNEEAGRSSPEIQKNSEAKVNGAWTVSLLWRRGASAVKTAAQASILGLSQGHTFGITS